MPYVLIKKKKILTIFLKGKKNEKALFFNVNFIYFIQLFGSGMLSRRFFLVIESFSAFSFSLF